jgi:hypothetical protein
MAISQHEDRHRCVGRAFQGLTTLLLGSKFTSSLLIRGNHGHTRNIQVF